MKSGRGGKRSRTERQIKAIGELLRYVATDEKEVEGGKWLRRAPDRVAHYHVHAINRLCSALPPSGWIHEEVEPGLHYFVIDVCSEVPVGQMFATTIESLRGPPMVIFANDLKFTALAYYPFLLSFADPDTAFRFYNGDLVIVVAIDMGHVSNILASRSFGISPSTNPDMYWEIERIGSGACNWDNNRAGVGWHIISRLGSEFLSLDWLLTTISHLPMQIPFDEAETLPQNGSQINLGEDRS